ncbi:MAG TPA: hypothetical protein ENJ55_00495 [Rhizobiales bacterium]|nr:hypothetical protein [Hyphomicrobiales bacterium]
MKLFTKATLAAAALATAGMMSLTTATPVMAKPDICKKVKIKITNLTGAPIQVFDLDYWDFGSNRKRSENISNRVLANGDSYKYTRNLEGVNNAKTFVRVQFRKLKRNGKWKLTRWWNADSATSVCTRGKTYTIRFR